jgi:predicted nucleotidyltransferase
VIPLIKQNLEMIAALCRHYGVERLYLFGSAATGAFKSSSSDLDFLVSFAESSAPGYADRYLDFAEALERLFGREVDLTTENSIRNPYFRSEIESTRRLLYERRNEKAIA